MNTKKLQKIKNRAKDVIELVDEVELLQKEIHEHVCPVYGDNEEDVLLVAMKLIAVLPRDGSSAVSVKIARDALQKIGVEV